MLTKAIFGLLFIASIRAHFLQCEYEDSLESVDSLEYPDYAEKAGVVCGKWPFYAGGFAHGRREYHSSSSSEEESSEDDDSMSLLPEGTTSDSVLYGFDDAVETRQCLATSSTGFCTKWVITKQEYEEKGCGGHRKHHGHDDDDHEETILTEYQLCLCADDNYGTDFDIVTSAPILGSYCLAWACLEFDSYPAEYNAYSLVMDNDFVMSRSWSSSESGDSDSSEERWEEPKDNGDYYRFAKDGETMELDESMEFSNCWCKASALNGKYCLNWYCESLEHDEYGCHKSGFGVEDHGWFGCYDNQENIDYDSCQEWYGFLLDWEEREEYRCVCTSTDGSCDESICGISTLPLRRNYMWYNFPLAMILWVCLCGCCGTKQCYKRKFSKCNRGCFKALKHRKCRLVTFFITFGIAALLHGGIPALLFFTIFFKLSICCARKCENCKCSRRCSPCGKKWLNKHEVANTQEMMATTITSKDGENSKERKESLSEVVTPEEPKVSKSGHIRVNSVDLDEVEVDAVTQV